MIAICIFLIILTIFSIQTIRESHRTQKITSRHGSLSVGYDLAKEPHRYSLAYLKHVLLIVMSIGGLATCGYLTVAGYVDFKYEEEMSAILKLSAFGVVWGLLYSLKKIGWSPRSRPPAELERDVWYDGIK